MRRLELTHDVTIAARPLGAPPRAFVESLREAARAVTGLLELYVLEYRSAELEPPRGVMLAAFVAPTQQRDAVAMALDRELARRFDRTDSFTLVVATPDQPHLAALAQAEALVHRARAEAQARPGAFEELVSRYAMIGFDKQLHLAEVHGEEDWTLDLEAGLLTFTTGRFLKKRRSYRCQVLGSESHVSDTWLWAWANEQSNLSEPLLAASKRLLARGQRDSIAELTTPKIPLEVADGHTLSMVASGILDAAFYYRAPSSQGAVFILVVDRAFARNDDEPALRFAEVVPEALMSLEIENHRAAVTSYARYLGLRVEEHGHELTVSNPAAGRGVAVRLDGSDRVVDMELVG